MSSALRFLITLFTILCCTTIARAATLESCAGIFFKKAYVHEGAIGFFGSFDVANSAVQAEARAYQSFSAFKRAEGAAAPGQAWHHVVEQTPGNVQQFGTQAIHSTENLVRLPHGSGTIHNQISGFYSSKRPFTGGQTVRQWLSPQSFEQQSTFGRNIMQQFGGAP
jgi:hypothetical protein